MSKPCLHSFSLSPFVRFTEVDASATELVKSFSEDPKKTGIDDFMRELLEFLKRFDRAQRENTARELKASVITIMLCSS